MMQEKSQDPGRSVAGYNLYQAVHSCAPLLLKYGGHAQAVGLTLSPNHLSKFITHFQNIVATTLAPAHREPTQTIDLVISLAELSLKVGKLLERMAPFGPGHMRPLFATSPVSIKTYKIYDTHIKIFFTDKEKKQTWEAIGFNMAPSFKEIEMHEHFTIAYKVALKRYRGVDRLELILKDIKPCTRKNQIDNTTSP